MAVENHREHAVVVVLGRRAAARGFGSQISRFLVFEPLTHRISVSSSRRSNVTRTRRLISTRLYLLLNGFEILLDDPLINELLVVGEDDRTHPFRW